MIIAKKLIPIGYSAKKEGKARNKDIFLNSFIEKNRGLIFNISKELHGLNQDFSVEEIRNEIVILIPRFYKSYDSTRGVKICSYVFNFIKKEMKTVLQVKGSDFSITKHGIALSSDYRKDFLSLDVPLGDKDGNSYYDIIESSNFSIKSRIDFSMLKNEVVYVIDSYYGKHERNKKICFMFFFDDLLQSQICVHFHISRERIRKIIEPVRTRLQRLLAA